MGYLNDVKQFIKLGEKRKRCRNLGTRRRFNNLVIKLQGGKMLGQGWAKFALDDEIRIPCIDGQDNPVGSDMIQLILSENTYEKELNKIELLQEPQPPISDTIEGFTNPGFPLTEELCEQGLGSVNRNMFVCPIQLPIEGVDDIREFGRTGTSMMVVMPRGVHILDSIVPGDDTSRIKRNLGYVLLDLLYMLWRFDLNYMVHYDTRYINTLVQNRRGVLIDLEKTTSYAKVIGFVKNGRGYSENAIYRRGISAELFCLARLPTEEKESIPELIFEIVGEANRSAYIQIASEVMSNHIPVWSSGLENDLFFTEEKYTNELLSAQTWRISHLVDTNLRKRKSWEEIYKNIRNIFQLHDAPPELTLEYWNSVNKMMGRPEIELFHDVRIDPD